MHQSSWIHRVRGAAAVAAMLGLTLTAGSAGAATRSMTGSLGVINPSTATPFLFESEVGVFGKKAGAYAPTDGFKTISVTGATASTSVGRQVTVPANRLNWAGDRIRFFPSFGNVGQTSKVFSQVQNQATFMVGAGALAECPGPGCTASGLGTQISWCPPLVQPATPAPGTAGNQIGDWSCPSYPAGAIGGNRGQWIRISNSAGPAANHFGGTLSLIRNETFDIWRILVQPGTQGTPAEASRQFQVLASAWAPGQANFNYLSEPSKPGPRILAALGAQGQVTQTFGCVNGVGTVGQPFSPGNPAGQVGSNCGTPAPGTQPLQNWGFKMTTGTISGSDFYPFLDATTVLGTPFAPNFQQQAYGDGFFFTRMGTDTVMGTSRNLVLLGGGVAVDPPSGNAYFRISDLRLSLTVPEPAMGLGLIAGATALVALARRRTRS